LEVENCLETAVAYDECAGCKETFQLSDDALKCLPEVANCGEYESSSIFSEQLRCRRCKEGYYFNSGTKECVQGSVDKCATYRMYSNECERCEEGYFIDQAKTCQEHSLRSYFSCQRLSPTQANLCDACGENQIKVRVRNFCASLDSGEIGNCLEYSDGSHCETCAEGFLPNSDSTACEAIAVANCRELLSGTECAECMEKTTENYSLPYVLDDNKLCQEPIEEQFKHCNGTKLVDEEVVCETCEKNFYPAQLPFNSRICLKRDHWLFTGETLIANCQVWDEEEKCIQCVEGYFVEDGGCVTACSSGNVLHYKEIYKNLKKNAMYTRKVNYCLAPDGAYSIPNCARYHTSVRSRTLQYGGDVFVGCVKCAENFTPIINPETFNTTTKGQAHSYKDDSNVEVVNQREIFINRCIDFSAVTDGEKLNGASTSFDNCKHIAVFNLNNSDDAAGDRYGCMACADGYTGLPVLANGKYYIESCQVMGSCSTNFYEGLGSRVQDLQLDSVSIFPTSLYVSCHECTNTDEIVFYGEAMGN
jgi:hypothetical protein